MHLRATSNLRIASFPSCTSTSRNAIRRTAQTSRAARIRRRIARIHNTAHSITIIPCLTNTFRLALGIGLTHRVGRARVFSRDRLGAGFRARVDESAVQRHDCLSDFDGGAVIGQSAPACRLLNAVAV